MKIKNQRPHCQYPHRALEKTYCSLFRGLLILPQQTNSLLHKKFQENIPPWCHKNMKMSKMNHHQYQQKEIDQVLALAKSGVRRLVANDSQTRCRKSNYPQKQTPGTPVRDRDRKTAVTGKTPREAKKSKPLKKTKQTGGTD